MKKNMFFIILLIMNMMNFAQEQEESIVACLSKEECAENVSGFIAELEEMNMQERNCFLDIYKISFNIAHEYLTKNKLSLDKLSRFNNNPDVSQETFEEAQELIDGIVKSKINKKILCQHIACLREYLTTMSEHFKTNNLTKKEKIKADLINMLYSSIGYHVATNSSTTYDHQTKKLIIIKKIHEIVYKNDSGKILESYENTDESTELEE